LPRVLTTVATHLKPFSPCSSLPHLPRANRRSAWASRRLLKLQASCTQTTTALSSPTPSHYQTGFGTSIPVFPSHTSHLILDTASSYPAPALPPPSSTTQQDGQSSSRRCRWRHWTGRRPETTAPVHQLTPPSHCPSSSSLASSLTSSPSTMSSTRPVSLPTCPTSQAPRYEFTPTAQYTQGETLITDRLSPATCPRTTA
jgi:hypothetical protein